MEKRRVWLTASYILAIGYILLGYCLYEWSFKMVPYAKNDNETQFKVAWDLFTDVSFVAIGIALLISSLLISKRNQRAKELHSLAIWVGIVILISGNLIFSRLVFAEKFLDIFVLDLGVLIALYIPAIVLYFTGRKIAT